MAQPQAYNRETDFTERDGDDTNHAGVNTELDAAALSINEIRDNLALIQRDDGALKNGIVTAESLSDSAFNAVLGEVATATAAASASADRSTLFATQAESDRIAAQAAAAAAQSSQTAAATSATAAASSQTAAANSATSAATSASTATTKANEAGTSATNAATSATAAAGSATSAETQATNAAASATAAATSATNSATSAGTAATQAGIATTQATNAATSATEAAASFADFNDRYLGAKSTAPTVDNDGNPLQVGTLYYDTTLDQMRVYTPTGWGSASSSVNGTSARFRYIATGGQTTFTGVDSNGNTLAYDAGFVDVHLNGLRLDQTDYTATSGTSIVLASGAGVGDELNIVAFGTFTLANLNAGQIAATDGAGGSLFNTVAGFITRLMSSAGSALMGFIQSGAGAVARTVQDELRDRVSVKQFGADTTGGTSAVAAIQACQAAHPEIRFTPGTYLIDTNLTISSCAVIEDGAKFSVSAGVTLAFGPGAVDEIRAEWFYTSGGYQAAINKAIAVQRASVVSGSGMATYGQIIPISLQPNKSYVISGSITAGDYFVIHGNGASIRTSAAYPFDQTYQVITGIGYQPTIKDIHFFGGTDVLVFPENAQGFDIVIDRCKFTEWSGTAIKTSPVPHAQHLVVQRCEFTPRKMSAVVSDTACDTAVFTDCQYTGPSLTKFINRNNLNLVRWICSPLPAQGGEVWTYPPRWILNEGLTLNVQACRFGGEPGAHRLLENNSTFEIQSAETSVVIRDNEIYTGGDYFMVLANMPSNFIVEENKGFIGGANIKYAGSNADNLNIGRGIVKIEPGNNGETMFGSKSTTDSGYQVHRLAPAMNQWKQLGTETVLTAQKIKDVLYGALSGAIAPQFTVLTSSDPFGATTQRVIGSDGDNTFNSYSYFTLAGALTGQPAGIYTLVVNIQVGQDGYRYGPVLFGMNGSKAEKHWNLHHGNHTLSLQFHWNGSNNPDVGYSIYNVNSGTEYAHNGLRLFFGAVDCHSWNSVTYGGAAPTTGYHRIGDRVIRTTPVVGQPKSWVCTAAGTPGTWVSEGNL